MTDNINQLLITTLSEHGPVRPDIYTGKEEKYMVFNYPDETAAVFADNRPHRKIIYVQVHLFLPDNDTGYQEEKEQICRELKSVGFSWPEVTILHERESGKRHIIFETKIKRTIKWEE